MKNQLMNKPVLQLLLAVGLSSAAASRSDASVQTSSEVWVGSSTPVQGNGGSGSKVSIFSQRMIRPLETAGSVSGLQNTVLTDASSTWADGQFGTKGVPAYVEFNNGWMADIADCSAANHCLTLAGNMGSAVSVGDVYRVRKHFTIATMFGTNNEAGLKGGASPLTADNILLENPQTQQITTIFYYDNGPSDPFHAWLRADYSLAADQVIYPEQGLMVSRKLATGMNVYLAGPVKIGASVVTIDPGYNLVGTLKSATALPLAGLNLYTGDPTTGLASGQSPGGSDNLLVIQPDGSTATFFYYKDSSFEGWLDAAFKLAGTTQFTPGSAFFIQRKAVNAAFNWTIPAE